MARKRAQRPKGSGSVRPYKRSGKLVGFRAEVSRENANFYASKTFLFSRGESRDHAEAWVRSTLAELDAGKITATGTLGDWLTAWLKQQTNSASAKTSSRDGQVIESHIREHLGNVKLAELNANAINSWLSKLVDAGATGDQRHRAWSTLRKILKSHSEFDTNKLQKVKPPKVVREKGNPLDAEQYANVVATAARLESRPWLRAWVFVSVECCTRPREAIALDWSDYASGAISIRKALCPISGEPKVPKTKSSIRDVPLSPAAREAVEAWQAKSGGKGWIFPSTRSGHMTYQGILIAWRKLAAVAGVPDRELYDLRHTGATLLMSAGMSPAAIARRMGHSSTDLVFRTYGHALPKDQDRLTGVFASIIPLGRVDAAPETPKIAETESS